jgi:hypothetical protein
MPEVSSAPEANKNDTTGPSAGEKPAASVEGPRKMTKPANMKGTTGATNPVKNETAMSAAGSVTVGKGDHITWRGGLNGPLAIIMARGHDRIMNESSQGSRKDGSVQRVGSRIGCWTR